jgi:polar amino acid transport system permease protein
MGSAVLALTVNVGCYNAEVIRAGIEAVPKGQTEAALSLGLSRFLTMRFIVIPQAFRIVVPPLINNIVALLKDSSLVSAIGLLDLTLAGNRISSETFLPVPVLTTVALIYLALTTGITAVTAFMETRLLGKTA